MMKLSLGDLTFYDFHILLVDCDVFSNATNRHFFQRLSSRINGSLFDVSSRQFIPKSKKN